MAPEFKIIQKGLPRFKGEAWHFSVNWGTGTLHYIASAVYAYGEPEVLIFPANRDGKIRSWLEVFGETGTLDIMRIIKTFVEVGEW